jgi:uncharacterized repeat protein (TIGR03803 family)
MLIGTAAGGGSQESGTLFLLNTDGSGFAAQNFPGGQGAAIPTGYLTIDSQGGLLGTTAWGGAFDNGTIYRSVLSSIHDFSLNGAWSMVIPYWNKLYGIAGLGGVEYGGVFSMYPDGTDFTYLVTFTGGRDGFYGQGLTISGGLLYGTTAAGGDWGNGNIFRVDINGAGLTNLYNFTAFRASAPYTNADGASPGTLIMADNMLYGTAASGGPGIERDYQSALGAGTIFSIRANGTEFRVLHAFSSTQQQYPGHYTNSDGVQPANALVLSAKTLYGIATKGGTGATGTIFSISIEDPLLELKITPFGTGIVLSWPATTFGSTLQSTTNLEAASWTAVADTPVVAGGQNFITNSASAIQQFYRLVR